MLGFEPRALRRWLSVIAIGIATALLGVIAHFFAQFDPLGTSPAGQYRIALFDYLVGTRVGTALDAPNEPVMIVGRDVRTAELIGKQVPRNLYADALRRIADQKPKAILLDIVFSGRDAGGIAVEAFTSQLAKLEGTTKLMPRVVELRDRVDPDRQLSDVLAKGPFVLAFVVDEGEMPEDQARLLDESEPTLDVTDCRDVNSWRNARLSSPLFVRAGPTQASAFMINDNDSFVRRYPLFTKLRGKFYPSLAMAAAMFATDENFAFLECLPTKQSMVGGLNIGTQAKIPVSEDGTMRIDFRGRFADAFPNTIGFWRLVPDLDDGSDLSRALKEPSAKVPPNAFTGKVVFVGATGDLIDDHATAVESRYPGVAIHAVMANSLLSKKYLRRELSHFWMELVVIAVLGILGVLMIVNVGSPMVQVLVAAILPVAGFVISRYAAEHGYLVDALLPTLSGSSVILFCGIARYAIERRAQQDLSRYLSPAVAEAIRERPESALPTKKEISILFSDIRGFTTTAETMAPDVLAAMLQEYLTAMTAIVDENQGIVDKYIGDAVMALFGTPVLENEKHALLACRTAHTMIIKLAEMRKDWATRGLPPIEIGIGINTGVVSVGTMGAVGRREYTCIGDPVNFASRVEGLTKAYGARILVGENTRDLAKGEFAFRDLGRVKVKGKKKAVRIYELLETRATMPEDPSWITLFAKGMEAFQDRNWDSADAAFRQVIADRGSDPPSEQIMMWTKIFRMRPPEEEWDGTIERREK